MPIDITTIEGQKWLAVRGKFDERNFVHRFRLWRIQNDYRLSDVSELIDEPVVMLAAFEFIPHKHPLGRLSWDDANRIYFKLKDVV